MLQGLAVTVPAAVERGAAAGWVVPADVAKQCLAVLLEVQLTLTVPGREAEAAHAVHLHEVQIELRRSSTRRSAPMPDMHPLYIYHKTILTP